MISGKCNNTCAVHNCEVFDIISRKFTAIENLEVDFRAELSVVSIGYKIFAYYELNTSTFKRYYIYDVLKDQWCIKGMNLFQFDHVISCSKLAVV